MSRIDETTKDGGEVGKVTLEKTGSHVDVIETYEKQELQKLLTSRTSILSMDEEQETEENDKEARVHEEQDEESSSISSSLETRQENDTGRDICDRIKQEEVEEEEESNESEKRVLEEFARSRENEFLDFLRSKELSEDLINQLRENSLTDEVIRLLRALGFTDEDIAKLYKLKKDNFDIRDSESISSGISSPSSSDEYLSLDGLYLKNNFRKPLTEALREVVARKPLNPIEFLGHWLLHFKVCEERERRRKEFEAELMMEREKLRISERVTEYVEEKASVVTETRDEEEQLEEDWNFFKYKGI